MDSERAIDEVNNTSVVENEGNSSTKHTGRVTENLETSHGFTDDRNLEPKATSCNTAKILPQIGSIVCRICYNTDNIDRFISPCLCKGSLGFVHLQCLELWLSRSGLLHCELCMFKYKTKCTLKYNCCQSLRLWFSNPNNRRRLHADCIVYLLLTIATLVLASMSVLGMLYFHHHRDIYTGFSDTWMNAFFIVFMIIFVSLLMAYAVNSALVFRFECCSWYRWWQSMRYVRVILEPKKQPTKIESRIQDVSLQERSRHMQIITV